ncbi:hypothetical protein [Peribacillus frigoritolerans]|uniref:hypothetical protein n=1 Tax=Peribacillus frigoritolerans TaxID=450367 RepID=UPI0021633A0F|nr:hypothetical protein [Peribacillus frigoritolerans]
MKKVALKSFLVFTLVATLFSVSNIAPKEAAACYPAYKCMSKSHLPSSYKLTYQNKDRSKGIYVGGTVILGAAGVIPGMTYPALLGSVAYGGFELTKGYLSYKTYMKKNPASNKTGMIKIVHYKDKNFKGKTKTTYSEW